MAIGTAAAIGLGVAGVGSALSASSNKKAASNAANVSQQNNTENNALAREIYGKNQQALSPFMERGNAAGSAINALLGIAPAQTQQTQQTQPNAFSQFVGSPNAPTPFGGAGAPYSLGDYAGLGRDFFDARSYTMSNTVAPTAAQTGVTQPTTEQEILSSADQQNAAFDNFRNSTGYQFRLGEGMDALNSGFAASGMLQSGARDRAAMEYGQNFASNEFGNYMNALGLQQSVGAGSASSLAGVGQNYASQVINSNNQNAANQANAALVRGNNNVLGNVAGVIGGSLLGGGF
jgi:hypothetical protein